MKKLFVLLLVALALFSCQSEDNSVTQQLDSALTKSAPLSRLVARVAQNPTHSDNVLDGTDCYSVKLPVTITVNWQTVTLNDESDFDSVEDIIHASGSDDDLIHFAFPIVIVFPDFHETTITSQAQLDQIDCSGDDDFHEIRCLDFVFPITINTYNTNNQIANTIAIGDNYQLYHFIEHVAEEQIFSIVYPVDLILSGGQTVTANNNNELEDLIEDSIDDCDNDSGESGSLSLEEIIASGAWHISFCESDGQSGPGNYEDYNFAFHDNGTITVEKNANTSYGTWDLYQDGSHEKIELEFTDPALHHLEDDWKVVEYNENTFRLKKDGGGHGPGGNDYVYFTKN